MDDFWYFKPDENEGTVHLPDDPFQLSPLDQSKIDPFFDIFNKSPDLDPFFDEEIANDGENKNQFNNSKYILTDVKKIIDSIMESIHQNGGQTIENLSKAISVNHQRISEICSVLEHLGIIRRKKISRRYFYSANSQEKTGETYDINNTIQYFKSLQKIKDHLSKELNSLHIAYNEINDSSSNNSEED